MRNIDKYVYDLLHYDPLQEGIKLFVRPAEGI